MTTGGAEETSRGAEDSTGAAETCASTLVVVVVVKKEVSITMPGGAYVVVWSFPSEIVQLG